MTYRSAKARVVRRAPYDHGQPIRAIDTQPIAILVTLLAILILLAASGTKTHALVFDLPNPTPAHTAGLSIPTDRLTVTETDQVFWNAQPVSMSELANILQERRYFEGPRGLVFTPDGRASYDYSLKVLALVEKSGNARTDFCFGGIEQHRAFGKAGRPVPVDQRLPLLPCNVSQGW